MTQADDGFIEDGFEADSDEDGWKTHPDWRAKSMRMQDAARTGSEADDILREPSRAERAAAWGQGAAESASFGAAKPIMGLGSLVSGQGYAQGAEGHQADVDAAGEGRLGSAYGTGHMTMDAINAALGAGPSVVRGVADVARRGAQAMIPEAGVLGKIPDMLRAAPGSLRARLAAALDAEGGLGGLAKTKGREALSKVTTKGIGEAAFPKPATSAAAAPDDIGAQIARMQRAPAATEVRGAKFGMGPRNDSFDPSKWIASDPAGKIGSPSWSSTKPAELPLKSGPMEPADFYEPAAGSLGAQAKDLVKSIGQEAPSVSIRRPSAAQLAVKPKAPGPGPRQEMGIGKFSHVKEPSPTSAERAAAPFNTPGVGQATDLPPAEFARQMQMASLKGDVAEMQKLWGMANEAGPEYSAEVGQLIHEYMTSIVPK